MKISFANGRYTIVLESFLTWVIVDRQLIRFIYGMRLGNNDAVYATCLATQIYWKMINDWRFNQLHRLDRMHLDPINGIQCDSFRWRPTNLQSRWNQWHNIFDNACNECWIVFTNILTCVFVWSHVLQLTYFLQVVRKFRNVAREKKFIKL